MGNVFENEDDKQMKEPKLNQEKLEIPHDSKINEEMDNKEEEEEKEKEEKEEPKENESKEIEEESKEKKEESQEKEEEEPKDIEDEDEEPKDLVEERIESKEEQEDMEEQEEQIIKVEERENQENNEEQEQKQNEEMEQNEEMQIDSMKTPTKGKLHRFIQNGQIYQVDDKGQVYKVIQESRESSIENQGFNESYELNQEKNSNVVNVIYHDVAFRSGQKEENNREINNEKITYHLSNKSKRKEPKDSNPKVHILSRKKGNKKYNEKIKMNSELTDISRNEIGNKEYTMVIGDGMETGEYKFIGEKILIKENIAPNEKIKITQEEINSELNKRKNKKKEKKLKYEVIDKFYALTNISVRTIKKLEKDSTKKEQKNYFYSTLNTNNMNINNINNMNMNMRMNNTFSGMNSQYNNYESFVNINMPIQNRIQNMNMMNMNNMMNMPNMNISMPFDNYSRYFLSQVNKIRTEPQSFIGVIEDSKANIIKDRQGRIIYNGKIKVALNAGEAAFDEAIEYLKELNPMQPLSYNQMITVNTPVSENEILDKNDLTYKVESMINSGLNIKSYWRDVIKDPELSFLLMIIDDNGIKSGMRRKDILSPYMRYIGITSTEINKNFVCYVTLA